MDEGDELVTLRTYTAPDGRTWIFRRRPEVRQAEAATHVTLLVESLGEVRVVSCLREEWEDARTDFRALLSQAVPVGGSRGISGGDGRTGKR
jgi:hypothetical protein